MMKVNLGALNSFWILFLFVSAFLVNIIKAEKYKVRTTSKGKARHNLKEISSKEFDSIQVNEAPVFEGHRNLTTSCIDCRDGKRQDIANVKTPRNKKVKQEAKSESKGSKTHRWKDGRHYARTNLRSHKQSPNKRRKHRRKKSRKLSRRQKSRLRDHGYSKDDPRKISRNDEFSNRETNSKHDIVYLPPGLAKLERKIRPNPMVPVRKFVYLAQDVLRKVKHEAQQNHRTYDNTFNHIRSDFIYNLRNASVKIHSVNDMTYSVVWDAYKLSRQIYLRAHENRLTGPSTASLHRPDLYFVENAYSRDMILTTREEDDAKYLLNRLSQKNRLVKETIAKFKRIAGKLPDLMATLQKLNRRPSYVKQRPPHADGPIQQKVDKELLKKLHSMIANHGRIISEAGVFIADGFDANMMSENIIKYSKEVKEKILKEPNYKYFLMNSSQEVSVRIHSKTDLRQLVSKAKNHADNLQNNLITINHVLSPILGITRKLQTSGLKNDPLVYLKEISKKLLKDYQRLSIVIDQLMILTDHKEGIQSRCEDMEGSGYDPDSEHTILECEEFITEGSGSGSHALKIDLHPEDVIATGDDNDFDFIDTADGDAVKTKKETLGSKTKNYVEGILDRSKSVLQRASNVSNMSSENSQRWSTINHQISSMDTAHPLIKANLIRIDGEIGTANQLAITIRHSFDSINQYTNLTKQYANQIRVALAEKLKDVPISQNVTAYDGAIKVDKDDDKACVDQLEETLIYVRNNMTKLKTTTEPLDALKKITASMKSSLAKLRLKIQEAKKLTSTLQVPVSLSGSEYLSISMSNNNSHPSLETKFEVYIKPNTTQDAVVAMLQGNNTVSYQLDIYDENPRLSMYDQVEKDTYRIALTDTVIESGVWYRLSVSREGHKYIFSCESNSSFSTSDTEINEAKLLMTDPVHLYVAGFQEDDDFYVPDNLWKGCMQGLKFNGQAVNLLVNTTKGRLPMPCAGSVRIKPIPSVTMKGQGYMFYKMASVSKHGRFTELKLKFKTWRENSLLAAIINKLQRVQIYVHLTNGTLEVESKSHHQHRTLADHKYNDGKYHELAITFDGRQITVVVDDESFIPKQAVIEAIRHVRSGIFIGGMGHEHSMKFGAKFSPFSGCMSDITINRQQFGLTQADRASNVHHGTCEENPLQDCLGFEKSTPSVKLPVAEDYRSYLIAVPTQSEGQVIAITKTGESEFSLVLSLVNDVLIVQESVTVAENEIHLAVANQSWYYISIQDEFPEIVVSVGAQSVRIKYDDGATCWWGCKDDAYSVSLGGSDSHHYNGGISHLVINGREINLLEFSDAANFTSCTESDPFTRHISTTNSTKIAPAVASSEETDTLSFLNIFS